VLRVGTIEKVAGFASHEPALLPGAAGEAEAHDEPGRGRVGDGHCGRDRAAGLEPGPPGLPGRGGRRHVPAVPRPGSGGGALGQLHLGRGHARLLAHPLPRRRRRRRAHGLDGDSTLPLVFLTRVGSLHARARAWLVASRYDANPVSLAEEAPVGAREVRADCQRVPGEEGRHVPRLRRHARPHRRRPGRRLHERRGEASDPAALPGTYNLFMAAGRKLTLGSPSTSTDVSPLALYWSADESGGARRREALPDGDRERALPRQGTLPAPLVSAPQTLDKLARALGCVHRPLADLLAFFFVLARACTGAQLRRPVGALLRRQPWHGHRRTKLQCTLAR
jgi:hypothetical protein